MKPAMSLAGKTFLPSLLASAVAARLQLGQGLVGGDQLEQFLHRRRIVEVVADDLAAQLELLVQAADRDRRGVGQVPGVGIGDLLAPC